MELLWVSVYSMRNFLAVLVVLLFSGPGFAACPTTLSDCPSPAFNNVLVNGTLSVGSTLNVTGATTVTGLTTVTGGLNFPVGGSFAAGRTLVDGNFGLLIRPLGGKSVADFALYRGTSGLLGMQMLADGSFQIPNGLWLKLNSTTTWSGSSIIPPNAAFLSTGGWTGTVPNSGGDIGIHYLKMNPDTLVASTASSISNLLVEDFVGAGATGDRVGGYFKVFQTGVTGDVAAHTGKGQYIASSSWAESSANAGGTARTQAGVNGGIWGSTLLAIGSAGGTFLRGIQGLEIDVHAGMVEGAGPLSRIGSLVVNYGGNTAQGLTIDSAYTFSSTNGATKTFKYGYAIGLANSSFPLDPNGIGFGVDASEDNSTGGFTAANNTMGWLLEGTNGRYNGGLIRGPGFRVGPDGSIVNGPLKISYSGATSTIDASQFVGPTAGTTFSGGTLTSGGTGLVAGSRLTDAYGGVYVVNTVSGGVATLITVYTQPMDSSTHTGAVTLTADGQAVSFGAGGTITVTQTWTAGTTINLGNTAATGVNIGGSATGGGLLLGGASAKVGFYGATPIVKQTGVAVSAAGVHAALVNLGLIAP